MDLRLRPRRGPVPDKGNIALDATTGVRQFLLGAQIPASVGAPATVQARGANMAFEASPGYAGELQRLRPASAGRRWVAWLSPAIGCSTDPALPQYMLVDAEWALPDGPDGSPFTPPTLTATWVVGVRTVTSLAPAHRPVQCGSCLTQSFTDTPDPLNQGREGFTFCLDSEIALTRSAGDYGVLPPSAAQGRPGSLVTMPFILRNSGADPDNPVRPVRATTTLPGATAAVTPGTPSPGPGSDSTAFVVVGIPATAAPGTDDVTFTADLRSSTRVGVGKLTVLPAPAGSVGPGGTAAPRRRRLTTVLPKGLAVAVARARGIPVLIGLTRAGRALVRLQQGPARKPRLTIGKRVRLKAPGPVKVTFKNRRLAKGPYRVAVTVAGKVVKRASGRLVR